MRLTRVTVLSPSPVDLWQGHKRTKFVPLGLEAEARRLDNLMPWHGRRKTCHVLRRMRQE